tara:strand:- start:12696 stop:12938 length:243 start_codon:yes stop_codon:yes gene_type:complete
MTKTRARTLARATGARAGRASGTDETSRAVREEETLDALAIHRRDARETTRETRAIARVDRACSLARFQSSARSRATPSA